MYTCQVMLQRAAVGQTQGFVKRFLESSTGWWAILQLLCSQARNILHEELLKRNKQNLNVRPIAARCTTLEAKARVRVLSSAHSSWRCDGTLTWLELEGNTRFIIQGQGQSHSLTPLHSLGCIWPWRGRPASCQWAGWKIPARQFNRFSFVSRVILHVMGVKSEFLFVVIHWSTFMCHWIAPLDLLVMEVHREDVREAGVHQHLGDKFASYRTTPEPFAW